MIELVVSLVTSHNGLFLKANPKVTVQVLDALFPVVAAPLPLPPTIVGLVPHAPIVSALVLVALRFPLKVELAEIVTFVSVVKPLRVELPAVCAMSAVNDVAPPKTDVDVTFRVLEVESPVVTLVAFDVLPPVIVAPALKVASPANTEVLVTFNVPPRRKLFAWVTVVPLIESVDVPNKAPPVVPQNGKLFVVIALEVVTVPLLPEQVLVATSPDAVTERQPVAPARLVIEKAVVVA